MSTTTFIAFQDDITNLPCAYIRERQIQAFYDTHSSAAKHLQQFKWGIAAMLLVVGIAAWADENKIPDASNSTRSSGAVSTNSSTVRRNTSNRDTEAAVTKFIDGPTGFVFVYTEEGWKFVPGSASAD